MGWEGKVLLWVQESLRTNILTPFFRFISRLTDHGEVWFLLSAACLLFRPSRRTGLSLLFVMAVDFLLVNVLLKNAVSRVRPFEKVEGLSPLVPPPSDYSFPSGHTAICFAMSCTLFLCGHKTGGIFSFVYALLVAFSRLYLGVHYPTDIIAGGIVGVFVAVFSYYALYIT